MNKQEAIERIKNIETLNIKDRMDDKGVDMVIKNQVIDIISQIDEPQKPVIPKFVAEWIEWCKANYATLLGGISPIDELGSTICSEKRVKSRDAARWAEQNQETFARAWLYCYEVEKEKLYTVRIPNPNRTSFPYTLYRNDDGKIIIIGAGDDYEKREEYQLTEAEIKQDFEWAWDAGFAKEVEEN